MDQMSFFSAAANGPSFGDLAGVLCCKGQIVSFGTTAARLSVVVDQLWRAEILAGEFDRRGVAAEIASSDSGHPLIRTAFRSDLMPLATEWHRGAVKAVPKAFVLTGPILRMWALAGGWRTETGYQLGLDHRAGDTHSVLIAAVSAVGFAAVMRGPRSGGPAIRVSGRRRLARLAELIGDVPQGAEAAWPLASEVSKVG